MFFNHIFKIYGASIKIGIATNRYNAAEYLAPNMVDFSNSSLLLAPAFSLKLDLRLLTC